MTERNERLRKQVIEVGAWALSLPALAFWPFLSAMPAFSLVGEGRPGVVAANLAFLLTGFWPALIAAVVYAAAAGRARMAGLDIRKRSIGLALGLYATLWTAAYGVYKLA
jgi:hypothetical protein